MADQIFAVSQYTKNIIVKEYGIDSHKIQVVHNSMEIDSDIDESYNVHTYLELMKKNGYKVVVNIGRLTIQKGLTHLLEAAQKVVQKDSKVIFLIAGNGEQLEELIRLAAHYRISSNVIFESWVSGKNWRDTYRIGDMFIMPSVSEPFGLTALEAVGFGTPVIVSKQSGVAEVLQNCFKVDFWDTDQMADMILAIAENDSLAHTMWQNSYEEYKSQSWAKSARKMTERYHYAKGLVS
jgi:glycosyltransferase involved in cell wall biosynthesis